MNKKELIETVSSKARVTKREAELLVKPRWTASSKGWQRKARSFFRDSAASRCETRRHEKRGIPGRESRLRLPQRERQPSSLAKQ